MSKRWGHVSCELGWGSLQGDGHCGEIVAVGNGIDKVRPSGASGGCGMSQTTLRPGIETYVTKEIPEILSGEAV